jgi:hypothetical protein
MQIARSSLSYVPTLPQKQAPVVSGMRRLSGQYLRYGSRRIRVFLGREGLKVGKEACQRLRAQHGLQVPKSGPDGGLPDPILVRWPRRRPTRYGALTLCTMRAPMASG